MIRNVFSVSALFAVLASFTFAARAGEIYGGIGLPGVMLGFAQPLGNGITLRADLGTAGRHTRDYNEDGIKYQGHIDTDRLGLFADWFAFSNGFRFIGGVTFNNYKLNLHAQGNGSTITIGNTVYASAADDRFDVEVKFPRATPYVGIGYGHQAENGGLGFVFDLGASYGRATLTETHSGTNLSQVSQSDIDEELRELRDSVGKVRAIPQLSIGLNYRF